MTRDQQLTDARDKYHKLMTGTLARVFVDQNGERVEYTATNASVLLSYIRELEKPLPAPGVSNHPKPIGFFF